MAGGSRLQSDGLEARFLIGVEAGEASPEFIVDDAWTLFASRADALGSHRGKDEGNVIAVFFGDGRVFSAGQSGSVTVMICFVVQKEGQVHKAGRGAVQCVGLSFAWEGYVE